MKKPTLAAKNEHQKEFVKLFDSMCGKHSRYEVWQDFIHLVAIEISNAVDSAHRDARNKIYSAVAAKYTEAEKEPFAAMLGHIILGIEENQNQDFLGELYMNLGLGNACAGQFFTPYNVCKMMAMVMGQSTKANVEANGWIGVNDPACGAGATLIAFANLCREEGVNYQQHCLFVGQDLDYTVACMCYIQLSLLGCPGYVVVGDTLAHPVISHDKRGLIPVETDEYGIWYTPMFFHETWQMRRLFAQMGLSCRHTGGDSGERTEEPEPLEVPAPPEIISEPTQETAILHDDAESGQLTFF